MYKKRSLTNSPWGTMIKDGYWLRIVLMNMTSVWLCSIPESDDLGGGVWWIYEYVRDFRVHIIVEWSDRCRGTACCLQGGLVGLVYKSNWFDLIHRFASYLLLVRSMSRSTSTADPPPIHCHSTAYFEVMFVMFNYI